MIPLSEARDHVLAHCAPKAPVPVPLIDALGCVLAGSVIALEPVPPFDNSAMDGYAVRAADVASASADAPVRLEVIDTVHAGRASDLTLDAGQAIRIMTGAPVPAGADAIVQVEHTQGSPSSSDVSILAPVESGRHVRPAGDDVRAGEEVVASGTLLGPGHLGLLASVGVRRAVVVPRPRVAVLSTGDELVDDGRPLEPGQIRESNRPTLVALARTYGVDAIDLGTVPDDRDAIAAALTTAADTYDAVVTTGGVSMGDVDLVKVVLDDLADMRWMQVAIRPAKPFAFGVLDGTPIFGLPGNPVSSLVSLSLLALPGLRTLAARTDLDLPSVVATAGLGLGRRPDGRTAYLRVVVRWDDARSGLVAESVGAQGSHHLAATASANGLAVLPDGSGASPGSPVEVLLLAPPR